jgi:calcineurin-like phosphoesterase family protein
MGIYLCADHHLGHLKICEMTNRPFKSVEEMNETLIANHNAIVHPEDSVVFLGDVALGKLSETLPLVAQMNGHKTLILGNHDRPSRLYHHKSQEKREGWLLEYQNYFTNILESTLWFQPVWDDPALVLLHHLPYRDDSFVDHAYEGRYKEFQPVNDGKTILIHGHVHGAWKQKGRQINVGVDVWDYKPVSLHQLSQLVLPPSV